VIIFFKNKYEMLLKIDEYVIEKVGNVVCENDFNQKKGKSTI